MATRNGSVPLWVRYSARDQVLLLQGLSREAELAHRRLADFIWGGGQWPPPDSIKARDIAGVPHAAWPPVLTELESAGWRIRKGRLFNAAVAEVLREARATYAARQALSKAGNNARWSAPRAPAGNPDASPDENPDGNPNGIPNTVNSTQQNSTVQAVNPAERLTLSGSTREKAAEGESEFLEGLQQVLSVFSPRKAATEMQNWGGWWRNRFRENPAKARRVLAELGSMVRERKIQRNAGAAGADLWKRLP